MATPTALPSSFTAGDVLTAANMNLLRGAFRILQVVSTTKTDTFTTTSTSYTDLTGLSASITPSATSSLVFAQVTINQAVSGDILGAYQLVRGTTAIGIGDAAGNRTRATFGVAPGSGIALYTQAHFAYLDSPATTSATTYKVQLKTNAGTLYVNRTQADTDTATFTRTISTITLFEVSA